ncbi:hypothetical protein IT417_03700 [bacterium]|nr:hypothetical protein [bacterium]
MMASREFKRVYNKLGKFLDPVGLFLLLAVFVLPALTVVNLSPRSNQVNNVLGVESKKDVSVVMVGGVHDFLKDERISFPSEGVSKYEAQMIKHDIGSYSKPILQLSNNYESAMNLEVTGGSSNRTNIPLYLIYREKEYLIQDENGITNVANIRIPDRTKDIMYLKFDTSTPLRFNENVEVTIVQK